MRLLCEGPIQKSLNDSCVKLRKAEDGPPFEFRLVRLPKGGGVEYEGKHNLFTFLMDIFHLGNAAADIRFFCRRPVAGVAAKKSSLLFPLEAFSFNSLVPHSSPDMTHIVTSDSIEWWSEEKVAASGTW